MSTDKEIYNFITKPENIDVALEVAKYINELKIKLHMEFWQVLNSWMAEKIKTSGFSNNWKFEPFQHKYNKEWGKLYIVPISDDNKTPNLIVQLGQASQKEDYQLYRGVAWRHSFPADFSHQAINSIKEILIRNDCRLITNPYWISYGYENIKPNSADFLSRMNNEPDQLVGEVVNDLWKIFTECRPFMEEVNLAVSNNFGKIVN